MKNINKINLFVLFIVVFVISLIPVLHVGWIVGREWKGIVPEYIEDSYYYYARINDVVRGHPLIGNPYFIEHKDSMPPAFFVSDWVASIPFVIGLPFVLGVIFNIILWSEIFVFILYFIFKKLGTGDTNSIIFSVLTWLQVFWLFARPVAMQVIFPGYALFLLALLLWSENMNRINTWFILLASTYCVYSYTYLSLIVFFTFLVIFINYLVTKKYEGLKGLVKILLSILLLSVPFLVFTYYQINVPEYYETIRRIGLLMTHFPRMDFYYYGRWVIITTLLWFVSAKWVTSFRSESLKTVYKFFCVTGLGLIIAAGSNIVTGKELELSNHVGRFIIWWFSISFFVYLNMFVHFYRSEIKQLDIFKKSIIIIIILLCFAGVFRNIQRAFVFFRLDAKKAVEIQKYASPIDWLNKNVADPSVILADNKLSAVIPIYTHHYVLFSTTGFLQMVSDVELEDRYLVFKYFSEEVTLKTIEEDVALYGGAGKILKAKDLNETFVKMLSRYQNFIEPNINSYLRKYKVSYVLLKVNDSIMSKKLSNFKLELVYKDSNFIIYKFLYEK